MDIPRSRGKMLCIRASYGTCTVNNIMAKGTKRSTKKESKQPVNKELKPAVEEGSAVPVEEESKTPVEGESAVSAKEGKGIDFVYVMMGGGILIGVMFIVYGLFHYVLHML
jgi:hypothetical protein